MADRTMLMQKVASNAPLTAEEQAHVSMALETQESVEEVMRRAKAFNWAGLLSSILPVVLGLFTGGAGTALIPLINLILSIFKINPLPTPVPTPTPGGVIPPTPVASSPNS